MKFKAKKNQTLNQTYYKKMYHSNFSYYIIIDLPIDKLKLKEKKKLLLLLFLLSKIKFLEY
jgi:hypothetical protein